jgi:hypothetical protein
VYSLVGRLTFRGVKHLYQRTAVYIDALQIKAKGHLVLPHTNTLV